MVQVGCTINYGRSALWKARKKSRALTICVRSARILEVVRQRTARSRVLNSGPVAQLGARFHGMEEVVGSIPTRSTIFSTTCRYPAFQDRKSTRLNSSHLGISYAVFCL